MTPLLRRKLVVVTGKGGTGKTTIAAALAKLAAQQGSRVLLCEIDKTGDVARCFDSTYLGFEPREVEPGLFVMSMDTEKALQEYLQLNLKLPFVLRMGPFSKAFDFVATAAPGVREILTMGKLCWDVKREFYDIVIVDAPSTGHVIAQLASADSIGELVSVGPLVGQTAWMREILRDPNRTGVVVTTTPEETPVSETLDLVTSLRVDTGSPLAAVVVNRVLPELFVRDEIAVFDELEANRMLLEGMEGFVAHDSDAIFDAAVLASTLRRTQVEHMDRLQQIDLPLVFVPQSFGDGSPSSVLSEASLSLAAELDQ